MNKLFLILALAAMTITTSARDHQSPIPTASTATAEKAKGKPTKNTTAAPDFTLKDLNGKDLKLSSLRGKYVILDFWGSWCGWCIKGFPEMKKYYAKYNKKMEIVGIDCQDTQERWKNAVKRYELPWKHVYCPDNSDLLSRYRITGFPTKVIIDPKGNILKVVIGERPEFYDYLDSILK